MLDHSGQALHKCSGAKIGLGDQRNRAGVGAAMRMEDQFGKMVSGKMGAVPEGVSFFESFKLELFRMMVRSKVWRHQMENR